MGPRLGRARRQGAKVIPAYVFLSAGARDSRPDITHSTLFVAKAITHTQSKEPNYSTVPNTGEQPCDQRGVSVKIRPDEL